MENQTIIAIPILYGDARHTCEMIQNEVFTSYTELRERINKEINLDAYLKDDEDAEQPKFFSLSDFVDECNDQYFNLDEYFIGYVKIIEN